MLTKLWLKAEVAMSNCKSATPTTMEISRRDAENSLRGVAANLVASNWETDAVEDQTARPSLGRQEKTNTTAVDCAICRILQCARRRLLSCGKGAGANTYLGFAWA